MRPSEYSDVDPQLAKLTQEAFATAGVSVTEGASWTTDAPFRETQEAIDAALRAGILAVEMEAALSMLSRERATERCFVSPT